MSTQLQLWRFLIHISMKVQSMKPAEWDWMFIIKATKTEADKEYTVYMILYWLL